MLYRLFYTARVITDPDFEFFLKNANKSTKLWFSFIILCDFVDLIRKIFI